MKFSILITLVLILGFSAFGQTFSSDWQKVPSTFKGNDFEAIYNSLISSQKFFEKDEFETTAKFKERITNPENVKFAGNLTAADTLVFVYEPSPNDYGFINGLLVEYDADKEVLNATINTNRVSAYIDVATTNIKKLDFSATTVKSQTMKSEGIYVGENTFGVKRNIEKFRGNTFSLAIANIKDFNEADVSKSLTSLRIQLKLAPAEARLVKNNLSVVFITILINPYYGISSTEIKPTVDNPKDIKAYDKFLIGNVSEIWLFNRADGTIYSKIKAGQDSSSKNPTQQEQAIPKQVPRTISGGVLNGKAIQLVKPLYPRAAKALRAKGVVQVQVELDESGNVVSATATDGHPLLRDAAETAARQSKFTTTTLSGELVRVTGIIIYNF